MIVVEQKITTSMLRAGEVRAYSFDTGSGGDAAGSRRSGTPPTVIPGWPTRGSSSPGSGSTGTRSWRPLHELIASDAVVIPGYLEAAPFSSWGTKSPALPVPLGK